MIDLEALPHPARKIPRPIVAVAFASLCVLGVFAAPTVAVARDVEPAALPAGVTQHSFLVRTFDETFRYLVYRSPGASGAGPFPVIVMLHGLGGQPESFLELGRMHERLAKAVKDKVMPPHIAVMIEGRNGYWTNWRDGAHPYRDLVARDLFVDLAKRVPIASTPENTALMGLSMGGFGALSIGLQHPKRFGVLIALSPTDMQMATKASPLRRAYNDPFGLPIDAGAVRAANPFHLVVAGKGKGQTILLSWGQKEARKFKAGSERLAAAMRKRKLDVATQPVAGGRHGWASTWEKSHPWWIAKLGSRWKTKAPARKSK